MIGSSRSTGIDVSKDRSQYRPRRLREARKAARQVSSTQIRMRIVICLAMLLVGECCIALYTSPWLYVRHVKLEGVRSLAPGEVGQVEALTNIEPKTNLLRVNTRKLERDLHFLPFVSDAHVARRPLGSIVVKLTPRKPTAILENGADMWELDSSGIPIRPARADLVLPRIRLTNPLVVIPGALLQAEGAMAALSIQRQFPADCPAKIEKIDIDSGAELCLNMNDGVVVRMGQQEGLPAKLALVGKIYKEQPDIAARVESIDIRYPEAPACTLRNAKTKSKERRAHTDPDLAKRNMPGSTETETLGVDTRQ